MNLGDFNNEKANDEIWEHKPCLLIAGVGRSGTSFLTRAMNICGAYLGHREDLTSHEWKPVRYNLRGTWENKKIFDLQKKTYDFNNISDILEYIQNSPPLDPKKITVDENLGKDIKSYFKELIEYPSLACGLKYHLLLLDAWKNYLPKNLVIVGIFRHPLKMAESAKKLGWMDYPESLNLWKRENELLLLQLEKHGGFLLNFDWPREKLLSEMGLISKKLGLADTDFSNWYTEDLRHSDKTFQTNYKLTGDISFINSKLIEKLNHNENMEIKKYNPTLNELKKIVDTMIIEKLEFENYIKTDKASTKLPEKDSLAYKLLIYYNSHITGSQNSIRGRILISFLNLMKPFLKKIIEEEKS